MMRTLKLLPIMGPLQVFCFAVKLSNCLESKLSACTRLEILSHFRDNRFSIKAIHKLAAVMDPGIRKIVLNGLRAKFLEAK